MTIVLNHLIVLFVLMSGGTIMLQQYTAINIFLIASLSVAKLLMVRKIQISRYYYHQIGLMALIILLVLSINQDVSNIKGYISIVVRLLLLSLIPLVLEFGEFSKAFQRILFFLAGTSILIWAIIQIDQNFFLNFGQLKGATGVPYYNLWLYVVPDFRPHETIAPIHHARNGSIFYEPGYFSFLLSIAFLFFIKGRDGKSYERLAICILYILTIVTTQSTTGFACAILLITLFIQTNVKKSLIFYILFLTIFLFALANFFFKFYGAGSGSFFLRYVSTVSDMKIMMSSPFLGVGITQYKELIPEISKLNFGVEIEGSFNSFAMYAANFGLIFISLIIFYIVTFAKYINNKKAYATILTIVIILIGVNFSISIVSNLFLLIILYGIQITGSDESKG